MTPQALIESLSPRQQQVMLHCFNGRGVKETARDLGLSIDTVKDYRKVALMKLRVKTTEQAAVIAAKAGLL